MITAKDAMIEMLRRQAKYSLLPFLRYCWWMPGPLHVGRHTRALCSRLTSAVDDFRKGKNTYLIVNMPFRHGKSDLVSRALPSFFLGRCKDLQPNVIMSGYGSSLVKGFSANVQGIVQSDPYKMVFPGMEIDPDKNATDEWRIKGSVSSVYAQGLGGSITGKGGNLIIIDDYCKNAEEADSQVQRDKTWESFKTDLATRTNAPAHIIIVCATRWHQDDLVGRIYAEMEKDPGYPRYESLIFPAHKPGEDGWETLFPEHYNEEWYNFQRKNLGPYRSAALLDCDPKGTGECVFKETWLRYYAGKLDTSKLRIHIFVDGAKSKKTGSDFTCMWVVGRGRDGGYYVLDGIHERLNLSEKIDRLFALVDKWGGPRKVERTWWEQVGPMSDVESVRMAQNSRMYHFSITELHHTTNKDFRMKKLVVPFSNSQIWLPFMGSIVRQRTEGGYNGTMETVRPYDPVLEFVEDEYKKYTGVQDSIPHDDMLDTLADLWDDEVLKVFRPPDGGGFEHERQSNWTENSRSSRFR